VTGGGGGGTSYTKKKTKKKNHKQLEITFVGIRITGGLSEVVGLLYTIDASGLLYWLRKMPNKFFHQRFLVR